MVSDVYHVCYVEQRWQELKKKSVSQKSGMNIQSAAYTSRQLWRPPTPEVLWTCPTTRVRWTSSDEKHGRRHRSRRRGHTFFWRGDKLAWIPTSRRAAGAPSNRQLVVRAWSQCSKYRGKVVGTLRVYVLPLCPWTKGFDTCGDRSEIAPLHPTLVICHRWRPSKEMSAIQSGWARLRVQCRSCAKRLRSESWLDLVPEQRLCSGGKSCAVFSSTNGS